MKSILLIVLIVSLCESKRYIVQKSWVGYTCPSNSPPNANVLFEENSCLEDPSLSDDVKVYCKGNNAAGKVCDKGSKCQKCEDDNEVTLPSSCLYDSDTGSSTIFTCSEGVPPIPPNVLVTKHAVANSSCSKQQVWTYPSKHACVGVDLGSITKYYSSSCNSTKQLLLTCSDSLCLNCNISATLLEFNVCYPPGSPKQKPYEDQEYTCGRIGDSSASSLFSLNTQFLVAFSIFFLIFPSLNQFLVESKLRGLKK
eukprot:TRINITY_DN6991_c0_g1_i1.p1 TRINITY_DN6991_c0_g1~~TRINITY_DN6991_c0_g1_i1.p1  ORF type:complete len:283 (-),score=50.48 TRINITY_DN6991_c0_g1_i1:44-805(-)